METRSTTKAEGFISQTLGFPFAFAAKTQYPAFKLSSLTAFH